MPRGRTRSELQLSERREKAYELYMKGWSIKDVAEALDVGHDTASRYKQEYRGRIAEIAQANPGMLSQVLENTIIALEENDQIRKHAWEDYHESADPRLIDCPECGHEYYVPRPPGAVRNQILQTILKAHDQRSKLYGLFGVKAEFFGQVQKIRVLQEKLLDFMRRSLCSECRSKMIHFMDEEMHGEGAVTNLPAIPETLLNGTTG